jgi:uncharacterized protein YuzE
VIESYLEVTFRHGRPLAGYYYLPRQPGQRSYRCRELGPGLIVDFTRAGKPIGIEIIDPAHVTVAAMNRVLRQLKQATLTRKDLVPLKAA